MLALFCMRRVTGMDHSQSAWLEIAILESDRSIGAKAVIERDPILVGLRRFELDDLDAAALASGHATARAESAFGALGYEQLPR